MYQNVTPEDAGDIIKSLDDGPVSRLECATDQPFFRRQVKIVLENSGRVDPEKIEDYIAASGYEGLLKALTEFSPSEVIEQVLRSGLRGRGGAGYPTGLKWSLVSKVDSHRKYVICNGDEGDPGAFMDRSVLEGDPHRVLEGMAIAGYAIGASYGYIYVRAEYPLAIKNLKTAIRQAQRMGLLGPNIFGTTFSFNIDLRLGAGAFVCGEETALIASIEGRRGSPRPRPPYPAQEGLWGEPTLINNVETFANIAPIVRNGGDWFARIGTEKSKGTKVFALAGRVANTGLIEVPMGITLREIIYEIGGGIPDGRRFKAVQTGGPSGGCIPEESLDMPVDYESLKKLGSIMGSGGMIVMDDSSCMVDVAKFFMEFCMSESCGKCVPCRVGTYQMHELLQRITEGNAAAEDLAVLEELCDLVQNTSLCGLGQSAPNPVISTLRYFRDEYQAHVVGSKCPANVCQIDSAKEVVA
jgi:bidirectional [NiFe] hydrogenase diaphorase subunit